MEAIISPIVQMKELDSTETKKLAREQMVSKQQSWDSHWSGYSSKSEFLSVLKHRLVGSGAREDLEWSIGT